jgi:large subunit ribosomal protein L9
MKVILLKKIKKLGDLGEITNVKPGYARNFLIPQGKVKPATKENIAKFEEIKEELQKTENAALKDAQAKQEKMQDVVCVIKVNVSEKGKMFGSVGVNDIVSNLADQGFEIEKSNINMPESIRIIGEYEALVTIYNEISVNIKVIVEAITD